MAAAYESAYHIGQVRLRGGLPSTDARFTDAKLLNLLTDELQGNLAPLVHNAKAEHGIVQYSVSATVGQSEYALPQRAFVNTLRDVYWIDSSGGITPLNQRSAADPLMYSLRRNNGTPTYYYLRGSNVDVVPPPGAAGTLAMPHYARPNKLVLVGSACPPIIPVVSLLGGEDYNLTYANTADTQTALAALVTAGVAELISGVPGFETKAANVRVDSLVVSGSFLILNIASASAPVSGDYLVPQGVSPVPQCPVELFPLLHARAALVAVPSTGDMSQAASALAAQVADLEAKAVAFLQPRVESGSPPPGRGLGSNPLLGVVSGSWSGF